MKKLKFKTFTNFLAIILFVFNYKLNQVAFFSKIFFVYLFRKTVLNCSCKPFLDAFTAFLKAVPKILASNFFFAYFEKNTFILNEFVF